MPEETKDVVKEETDASGVPWSNRMKEFERKFSEKYENEIATTKKELEELKNSIRTSEAVESPAPEQSSEQLAKTDLMDFVKNPRDWVRRSWYEADFQKQIPEAESWIKNQKGYMSDDESKIIQIIKDNKLDTPYHAPMERARTAWKLLQAEKLEKATSSDSDEQRRETNIHKTTTEGGGRATVKASPVTRQDVIKKLAEAEAKGDLDAAIKYTSLLEDIR